MPSRLPSIIPRPRLHKHARTYEGRFRVEEVCGWGEEFVAEGQDAGVQGGGDEVWRSEGGGG